MEILTLFCCFKLQLNTLMESQKFGSRSHCFACSAVVGIENYVIQFIAGEIVAGNYSIAAFVSILDHF